jgi:hypothetical protein
MLYLMLISFVLKAMHIVCLLLIDISFSKHMQENNEDVEAFISRYIREMRALLLEGITPRGYARGLVEGADHKIYLYACFAASFVLS